MNQMPDVFQTPSNPPPIYPQADSAPSGNSLPSIEGFETESRSLVVVDRAEVRIVTEADRDAALERLDQIKALSAKIEKEFAEPKKKAWEAHRSVCALESKLLEPLRTSKKLLDDTVRVYLEDVRRKEREAEAARLRAEEEARRKAEAEAARLRAEAEARARELREAEMRRLEEAALNSAVALEEAGLHEEAEEVLAAPIVEPIPIPVSKAEFFSGLTPLKIDPPSETYDPEVHGRPNSFHVERPSPAPLPVPAKIKGMHLTTRWKAVVVDLLALVREIAAGRQAPDLVVPNQKRLDDLARGMQKFGRIPGVIFKEESSVVDRRK